MRGKARVAMPPCRPCEGKTQGRTAADTAPIAHPRRHWSGRDRGAVVAKVHKRARAIATVGEAIWSRSSDARRGTSLLAVEGRCPGAVETESRLRRYAATPGAAPLWPRCGARSPSGWEWQCERSRRWPRPPDRLTQRSAARRARRHGWRDEGRCGRDPDEAASRVRRTARLRSGGSHSVHRLAAGRDGASARDSGLSGRGRRPRIFAWWHVRGLRFRDRDGARRGPPPGRTDPGDTHWLGPRTASGAATNRAADGTRPRGSEARRIPVGAASARAPADRRAACRLFAGGVVGRIRRGRDGVCRRAKCAGSPSRTAPCRRADLPGSSCRAQRLPSGTSALERIRAAWIPSLRTPLRTRPGARSSTKLRRRVATIWDLGVGRRAARQARARRGTGGSWGRGACRPSAVASFGRIGRRVDVIPHRLWRAGMVADGATRAGAGRALAGADPVARIGSDREVTARRGAACMSHPGDG